MCPIRAIKTEVKRISKVLDVGWHYYLLFSRDSRLLVSATIDSKRVDSH
jgi:hypothetical protein